MVPEDDSQNILSDKQLNFALDMRGFTIDTSIFERQHFGLESDPLASLAARLPDSRVFALPQVIYDEILRHMIAKGIEEKKSLEKSLRVAGNILGIPKETINRFRQEIPGSIENKAVERLDKFLSSNNVQILSMDMMDPVELYELYAKQEIPFCSQKKSEFPDAGALLCLKAWAEDHGKLLVVTADKGWEDFCNQYPDLFYATDDLTLIFKFFLPETTRALTTKIIADVINDEDGAMVKIESEIKDAIANAHFEIEPYPTGSYYVEAEAVAADVNSIELMDTIPIHFDQENQEIKINFIFKVNGWVEGHFSFSIFDKEDREHYAIGDSSETREQDWECEAFAQFYYDEGTWVINEITINFDPDTIEFIDVEPDFDQE